MLSLVVIDCKEVAWFGLDWQEHPIATNDVGGGARGSEAVAKTVAPTKNSTL